MRLVFLSNYFNHHQRALSKALSNCVDEYAFVEGCPSDAVQRELVLREGQAPEYVICAEAAPAPREDLVVIAGSAPEKLVQRYIKAGCLVFRYSERPLKHGPESRKRPIRYVRWHLRNPGNKPIYMLAASAYTPADYASFSLFEGRTYKWGYFPERYAYENEGSLLGGKNPRKILWTGRYLDWKHPDDAIWVAARLQDLGYDFQLDLVGSGEMRAELEGQIRGAHLEGRVSLGEPLSPAATRDAMHDAGIYLFTSGFEEGWGAVLGEAMNGGCAVVASHAAGSTPYLVDDGVNGLIYRSGDREQLLSRVRWLLDDPSRQAVLGTAAYKTVSGLWNADVAAERFVNLAEHVLAGETSPDLYDSGPCSKAEIITNDWY